MNTCASKAARFVGGDKCDRKPVLAPVEGLLLHYQPSRGGLRNSSSTEKKLLRVIIGGSVCSSAALQVEKFSEVHTLIVTRKRTART